MAETWLKLSPPIEASLGTGPHHLCPRRWVHPSHRSRGEPCPPWGSAHRPVATLWAAAAKGGESGRVFVTHPHAQPGGQARPRRGAWSEQVMGGKRGALGEGRGPGTAPQTHRRCRSYGARSQNPGGRPGSQMTQKDSPEKHRPHRCGCFESSPQLPSGHKTRRAACLTNQSSSARAGGRMEGGAWCLLLPCPRLAPGSREGCPPAPGGAGHTRGRWCGGPGWKQSQRSRGAAFHPPSGWSAEKRVFERTCESSEDGGVH